MYGKVGHKRKSEVAAKVVLGVEGRATEGWTVFSGIFAKSAHILMRFYSTRFRRDFLLQAPNRLCSAQPRHNSETWQLISANVNSKKTSNVEQIWREIAATCLCTHSVADDFCLARDNVLKCGLSLLVLDGSRRGSTTLFVPDRICNVQKSWRSEETLTAVLFGSVIVFSVYAPDTARGLRGV